MRKLLLFPLLIILLAFAVSAKQPITATLTATGVGYDITYPLVPTYMQNNTNDFFFHVYNRSDGLPITSDINCYFHLYGVNKTHLAFLNSDTASDDFDYSFSIPAGNFTQLGDYSYLLHCNNTRLGGFAAVSFEVTADGKEPTEARGLVLLAIIIGITISLMGCAFLFAYIYANTDKVNRFLKILFLGAALLSGIGSMAVQEMVVTDQETVAGPMISGAVTSTYTMTIWIFRIVMAALLVWLIYTAAMNALGKKVEGPEQNG